MNSPAIKYSIIIPCFNEADNIRQTAERVVDYVKVNRRNDLFELILVNDGSTDKTADVLNALASENPGIISPIFFSQNLGRGAAIKAGIKRSTGEYISLLDADLSYDVEHLGKIFTSFEADHKLDVVVISPYMKGGRVSGVPFKRLLLSRFANWLLAGFFEDNLSTVTCVVRGYRGSLIRALPLFENGKELHLEILRKCSTAGAKILEVPGHLAWKEQKLRSLRKGVRVFASGMKHIWWGVLIRPTRVVKYLAMLFLGIGLYEGIILANVFIQNFKSSEDFWHSVWQSLTITFSQSPHSVVIACISLVLGFQSLFFIMLFQLLKLQQEESLRHLLAIWSEVHTRADGKK